MTDLTCTETWTARISIQVEVQETKRPPSSYGLPRLESLSLLDNPVSSGCEVIRSSRPGLARFRALSSAEAIVLFTPAVTPFDQISREPTHDKDPFELLGRALSQHHQRIRHVPYVPDYGFTGTHHVWLDSCDKVIVVTCEPSEGAEVGLSRQADFAESMAHVLDFTASTTSRVLVQFGADSSQINLPMYDNVLQSNAYNKHTAHQIMKLLFDAPG